MINTLIGLADLDACVSGCLAWRNEGPVEIFSSFRSGWRQRVSIEFDFLVPKRKHRLKHGLSSRHAAIAFLTAKAWHFLVALCFRQRQIELQLAQPAPQLRSLR